MDILHKTSPSRGEGSPRVLGFYEPDTGSCQYICIDDATGKAAIIDAVQQFDRPPPGSIRRSGRSTGWRARG